MEPLEARQLLSTRYVDVNAPGPVYDGTSWETAYVDLQQALGVAGAGDEIRVGDGIYKPTTGTDRTISFVVNNGVTLLGGYAGSGAPDPEARDIALYPTILSGDLGAPADYSDNSHHVVTGTGALLEGFTIADGNALDDPMDNVWGGGLLDGSGIVRRCTFLRNRAATGGAIGMPNVSTATIENCTFRNNWARDYGGAVGGENPKFTLLNCLFTGNSSNAYGGAYFSTSYGSAASPRPSIVNCAFVGNSAPFGAGLFVEGDHSSSVAPFLANCTLAGNYGSALHSLNYVQPLTARNCIIWGNTRPGTTQQIEYAGAAPDLAYSLVQGGWAGVGNVNANPQFLRNPDAGADATWGTSDDDYGDQRPHLTSPCLDAGNNGDVPPGTTLDLIGNPRLIDIPNVNDPGAIVDMGAYEYVMPLAATIGEFLFDAPLPTLSIAFNGDVDAATLWSSDLTVLEPVTLLPIVGLPSPAASYDPGSRTAYWTFPSPLPDGNYIARIEAASVDDLNGNPLSADYTFDFHILAADANRDRVVDLRDLYILSQNWLGTGKTFSQGDFNYDGVVDKQDLSLLAGRWQVKLDVPVEPAPAQPTSVGRRAPTRTPTRVALDILR